MPNNIIPYNADFQPTAMPEVRANPDDFGAQVGQAVNGLGQDIDHLGAALREHQDRENSIDGNLGLAQLRQSATQQLLQMENSPQAGSSDFTDTFNTWFDGQADKIGSGLSSDAKTQKAWQVGAANLRAEFADQAMRSQASQGAQLSVQKAQTGLATYVNTIATDPTQYDAATAAGGKLVDGLALPPTETNKLKQDFADQSTRARFDAMFNAAKTPQAVQGIISDLENGDWKNKMSAPQFNDLLRTAKAAQSSALKIVNAQAKAAVDSVEQRITAGAPIDPSEMAQVNASVRQTTDPLLIDKWARLQVQNDTTQRVKGMSTSALGDYIRANKTGVDAATPNSITGRAQDGMSYLTSKYGLSNIAALGPLANIGRETGFQPRPGDGGTSDGYFQWHLDRMTRARAAGATGTDIRKAIDYAMSEPEGQAWLAQAQAGAFKTPQQAALAWQTLFEKPKYPGADQPLNEQWVRRLIPALNGGKPLAEGPEGAPPGATPGIAEGGGQSGPTEFEYLRGKTAQTVLSHRNEQVNSGDQIQAAADAGLFTLGQLSGPEDFQTRGQQSQVAQGFLDAKENKPFTPSEVAAFGQVMQSGSIQQKTELLQNISSMGSAAPAAFKQIGEKGGPAAMFAHVGGLSTVSPVVAQDVLRGAQAMQANPDLKDMLTGKNTGPGPGGTAAFFDSIVGQAMGGMPKDAYAARQSADALYAYRVGPGAPWDANAYTQAVRDVMGGRQGDSAGGVATVNGAPTIMPAGVSGDDFQTMIHSLQNQDLLDHSVGGGPPMDSKGRPVSATEVATEGKFRAISNGMYRIYMADGTPTAGTGPGGLYAFQIDAKGVNAIIQRNPPRSIMETITDPNFWYHSSGGYGLPDTGAYKSEPTMQQQEDQITNAPPAGPIDLGRGAHVR
jgi:hypothetical protein